MRTVAEKHDLRTIIDALPGSLQADYAKNKDGFAGNTLQMDEASNNIVANLKHMWIDIATAGFPTHFGSSPAQWIEGYTDRQAQLSRMLNEPDGPGTGGTIVSQEVLGDLIDDLQRLVEKTVYALISPAQETPNYISWKERWKAAQNV